MKLRLPAIALFIGLTIATVPMRSLATVEVATQANDDLITELIVERLPGRSSLSAMSLIENEFDLDASVESKIFDRLEVIQLDQPITRAEADSLVQQLVDTGKVESAEINEKRYAVTAPNDPEYVNQWYLKDFATTDKGIGIESAWSHTTGSPSIVVAVIDTGYTVHPDLPTPLPGYDFFDNDADATDPGDAGCDQPNPSWHGTKVAGIIGAKTNNGIGVAGINQQSQIQHIRILGPCGGDTSDEIKAIRWAAGLPVHGISLNPTPARVLNLSLGGGGNCSELEQSAINDAVAAGAIVVVAAGNGGSDNVGDDLDLPQNAFSPANCNSVITVAATTSTGARASYTNFGSVVDIAAPGSNIRTTKFNGYDSVSGTSFATPIVSGIISLMLSVKPGLNYYGVLTLLRKDNVANSFPSIPSSQCSNDISATYYCGLGILDANHAVHTALLIALEVFEPLQPTRVADTRSNIGNVGTNKIGDGAGGGTPLTFKIIGTGNIPTTGVSAVSLNITAVDTQVGNEGGYLKVYPCASGQPDVSNLNFVSNQTIANAVIVPVDTNGNICVYVYGQAHILIDTNGWFANSVNFTTITPTRVADTRLDIGNVGTNKIGDGAGGGTPLTFKIAGTGNIPTEGVSAVSLNITAVDTQVGNVGGYFKVYPCASGQPDVSNLNFVSNQTIANAVIVPVDTNGNICVYVYGQAHILIDTNGWFAT
jgi:subtilisin family serine protease